MSVDDSYFDDASSEVDLPDQEVDPHPHLVSELVDDAGNLLGDLVQGSGSVLGDLAHDSFNLVGDAVGGIGAAVGDLLHDGSSAAAEAVSNAFQDDDSSSVDSGTEGGPTLEPAGLQDTGHVEQLDDIGSRFDAISSDDANQHHDASPPPPIDHAATQGSDQHDDISAAPAPGGTLAPAGPEGAEDAEAAGGQPSSEPSAAERQAERDALREDVQEAQKDAQLLSDISSMKHQTAMTQIGNIR